VKTKLSLTSIFYLCLFWIGVFLLNLGPEWHRYSSLREIFETTGTTTLIQALVAYVAVYYLVPKYLDKNELVKFVFGFLLLLLVAAELNIFISYFYLEGAYPNSYGAYYKSLGDYSLLQRMGFSPVIKYILFSKFPLLCFPAAVLIAVRYYQKQQSLLALREQKQAAELNALKNQLNPHFIFNTLNNIYALAIKRSELTAEAVAKLSGILDYVLYRCNDSYVLLSDEVRMINDYVALEKLRFSERLSVNLNNEIHDNIKVAPLLFLTLIENAFKHGVSQELKHAHIDIQLKEKDQYIEFSITNTKPKHTSQTTKQNKKIGLSNLCKQLDLLYPDAYSLEFIDTDEHYTAHLKLKTIKK